MRTYEPVTGIDGQAVITPENVGNPDLKPRGGRRDRGWVSTPSFLRRSASRWSFTPLPAAHTGRPHPGADAFPRWASGASSPEPGGDEEQRDRAGGDGQRGPGGPGAAGHGGDAGLWRRTRSCPLVGGDLGHPRTSATASTRSRASPIGGIFNKRVVSADIVERTWPLRNTATNIMCEGGETLGNTNFSRGGGAPVPCAEAPSSTGAPPSGVRRRGEANLKHRGQPHPSSGWWTHPGAHLDQTPTPMGQPFLVQHQGGGGGIDPSCCPTWLGLRRTAPDPDHERRLRQAPHVSLQYRLPESWANRVGAVRLSLSVAGDNLAIPWMGGPGAVRTPLHGSGAGGSGRRADPGDQRPRSRRGGRGTQDHDDVHVTF